MKKNSLILLIILSAAVVASLFLVSYSTAQNADKKAQVQMIHDQKMQEAIDKREQFKDSDRPVLDKKVIEQGVIAFDKCTIENAADVQLPMAGQVASQYIFTTVAYTPNNLIAVGSMADNPNNGVIFNFFVEPKNGDQKHYTYTIEGSGKLTLLSISDNKKVVTFNTETGKQGTFDVSDGKGSYTIN